MAAHKGKKAAPPHHGPCDLCLLYRGGSFGQYCYYYAHNCLAGNQWCSYSDENCALPTGGPCPTGAGCLASFRLQPRHRRKQGHANKNLKKNGIQTKWNQNDDPDTPLGTAGHSFLADIANPAGSAIRAKLYRLRRLVLAGWTDWIHIGIETKRTSTPADDDIPAHKVEFDEKLCYATARDGNEYAVLLHKSTPTPKAEHAQQQQKTKAQRKRRAAAG